MLKPVISLDAEMTAGAVIERLAANGFWVAADHPSVQPRLALLASRAQRTVDEVAKTLARDADRYGAAIRRQWGARVLWYVRELREVLERCANAPAHLILLDVMQLHETDAAPTLSLQVGNSIIVPNGLLMDDEGPVAVSLTSGAPMPPPLVSAAIPRPDSEQTTRSAMPRGEHLPPPTEVPAWPRIDAPDFTPALLPFKVIVGFGAAPQAGVSGAQVILRAAAGVSTIDVTIELSTAPGIQSLDGWSRTMTVNLSDVISASVQFTLVGDERMDAWHPLLSTLELRYLVDGTVCGTASKPIIILHSRDTAPPVQDARGQSWSEPAAAVPILLAADDQAPDLTIEISKPDRNAASGQYMCQLFSPHALASQRGPFPMDLGQDAKTFAGAIVEEVRLFAKSPLLDMTLESIGRLVAQRLPAAAFDALREVAAKVFPAVPAVLIVSAEPYVPWELAWVEPPLDAALPGYLGCQALVGRWLRDNDAAASATDGTQAPRPATHPIAKLSVRHMAVMAAWYQTQSGMRRLPMAEAEATSIVGEHGALALAATAQSMRQFLGASLENGFDRIGGVEAAHFAGHGDFDATRPDASSLFLGDGTPMRSNQFRAARYGGAQQPLLFLNACMLGIGGELLGDMGGFPGNSLRGGFGGVLGALWEIDDDVAHYVALEFWRRALPPAPAKGEAVGVILRDLRSRFIAAAGAVPVPTYLAYVYYGHPRLTLERAS